MHNAIFAVLLAGNFLSVNSWTDGAAMGSYLVDGKKKNADYIMKLFKKKYKSGMNLTCKWIAFSFMEQQAYKKKRLIFVLTTLKLCASMEGSMFCNCFLAICSN